MPTSLMDGNLLIALLVPEHVHHEAARAWFSATNRVATSPTVQGTLIRMLVRQGTQAGTALDALGTVTAHPRHDQWLDDVVYAAVDVSRVLGHRQVTDAYLAQLARVRRGRVATFDSGFVAAAPDVVDLVPG